MIRKHRSTNKRSSQRGFSGGSKFMMVLPVVCGVLLFYLASAAMGGTNIANTFNFLNTATTLADGMVAHWTFDGDESESDITVVDPVPSTSLIDDTFTEGSNTILTSHTSDSADSYTSLVTVGTCNLYVDGTNDRLDGVVSVSTGGCGNDEGQLLRVGSTQASADYQVSAVLDDSNTGSQNSSGRMVLACRIQDANNFYAASVGLTAAQTYITIHKRVSGTFSQVAFNNPNNNSFGSTFTFRCEGDSLSVLRNGVSQLSATDSDLSSAGYAGVGIGEFDSGAALPFDVVDQVIDDFEVATIASAGSAEVGASFTDRIGSKTLTTPTSSAFFLTPGPIGQALSFDGTDDYATTSDDASLDFGTGDFTISLWLKTSSSTAGGLQQYVIGKTQDTNPDIGYGIRLNNNSAKLVIADGTTECFSVANEDTGVSSPIENGEWRHVVARWDGGNEEGQVIVDTIPGTVGTGCSGVGSISNSGPLILGGRHVSDSDIRNPYEGALDDIRIFDRLISDDEIKQLYRMGATTKIGTTPTLGGPGTSLDDGLIEHWSFDGGELSNADILGSPGSTGDTNPTAGANRTGIGTAAWTNGGNIFSSNNSDASVGVPTTGSNYLEASTFGFSIPANAIITGIEVDIEKAAAFASTISDSAVRLVLADDSIGSTNKAAAGTWGTTDAYTTYGGSGDVWGETLTGADVNDADFGVVIAATCAFSTINAFVDHVRMNVYYTEAGTTQTLVQSRAVGGSDLSAWNGVETAPGSIGQALTFDGVDDYATTSDSSSFNFGTGSFTLATWVKTASSSNGRIFYKYDNVSTTRGYMMWINASGRAAFQLWDTGGSDQAQVGAGPSTYVADNEWHHVVAVRDGTNTRIYIDGEEKSSNTGATADVSGTTELRIGNDIFDDKWYEGALDDMRAYSRALSDDEIKQLYRMGATTKIATTPQSTGATGSLDDGLVAHYTFDGKNITSDGTNETILDVSSSGNDMNADQYVDSGLTYGALGQGFYFDGGAYALTIDDHATLDMADEVTLAAWVKPGSFSGSNKNFISKTEYDTVYYTNYGFGISTSPTVLEFYWSNPGNTYHGFQSSGYTFAADEWYHVAVSFKDSTNEISMYVNGEEVTTSTNGSPLSNAIQTNDGPLAIGAFDEFGTDPFTGVVDDVRVYNRILSSNEIKQLYQMGQ